MHNFYRKAPFLLIGLIFLLAACQSNPERSTADFLQASIAHGWTDNSDDPNIPVLAVAYDPEVWRTTDSFLYKPLVDLLNSTLPGCSLSGSGPHGGNPGWDIRQSDSPLQSEAIQVLEVYDAASGRLLFVNYQFNYPGVYFLVDLNLGELSPGQQSDCIRDAEQVLGTASEISSESSDR
jgi:hypothetical protein